MHISQIGVQNVLGVAAVGLAPKQPIVVIAGPNGAGKTSLYQAIRLAVLGDLPRIELKRDSGALVRGAAARGEVSVNLAWPSTTETLSIILPDRKRTGRQELTAPAVRACLDPAWFASLTNDERMKLVRDWSKVEMGRAAIVQRMVARSLPKALVDEVAPLLSLGFEKCVEHAKTQAAEARGAWRAVTGETYGSVKAATWEPEPAPELPEAPLDYEAALQEHRNAVTAHQAYRSRRATAEAAAAARAADQLLAGKADSLRAKTAELMVTAGAYVAVPTLTCPHCDKPFEVVHGGARVPIPLPAGPVEDVATVAKAKTDLDRAQRELRQAEAAAERLLQPDPAADNPTDDDLDQARVVEEETADALRTLNHQREVYQAAVRQAQERDAVKARAAQHHARAEGWERVAEVLAPAGIPSELMTQALAPFRAALKAACDSEFVREWPQPELTEQGSIFAWGRPYAMLSESEKYRADLLLTAAVAQQTNVRLLMADRFDVLSPKVRGEALAWLMDMTDPGGALDQAWLFATLKQPMAPGDSPIEAHWLENGAFA